MSSAAQPDVNLREQPASGEFPCHLTVERLYATMLMAALVGTPYERFSARCKDVAISYGWMCRPRSASSAAQPDVNFSEPLVSMSSAVRPDISVAFSERCLSG